MPRVPAVYICEAGGDTVIVPAQSAAQAKGRAAEAVKRVADDIGKVLGESRPGIDAVHFTARRLLDGHAVVGFDAGYDGVIVEAVEGIR